MAKKAAKKDNQAHDRRFLKTFVRRKPQSICLGANVVLFFVLLIIIYIGTNFYLFFKLSVERYERDKILIDKYHLTASAHTCRLVENDFDTTYCSTFCGSNSVSFRLKSPNRNSKAWKNDIAGNNYCINKYQMMDCHESLKGNKCLTGRKIEDVKECLNLKVASKPVTEDYVRVIAPAVDQSVLDNAKNQIVLANELVIHCPACRIISKPFNFLLSSTLSSPTTSKKCYVKLSTLKTGWPANFNTCMNALDLSSIPNSSVPPSSVKKPSCSLISDKK